MEDKKYKKDETTITVHKTTRDRLKRLKGRGISHDRFLVDLLDRVFPVEKEVSKDDDI